MYKPVQDGIDKETHSVRYAAAEPPHDLANLVHRFWELKSEAELQEDFHFHAMPDACVNILFNQLDTRVAGVTALNTKATVLNLGKKFHYVGIEFLPGVWQGNPDEKVDSYVGAPYGGELPLIKTGATLESLDFPAKQVVMSDLVQQFLHEGHAAENSVTARILASIDDIHSVTDMAKVAAMSSRQLQRSLKETTGFSPHDLLKVLRLQQSFRRDYLEYYTDQPHFIRSFKDITGYTPAKYVDKFNV